MFSTKYCLWTPFLAKSSDCDILALMFCPYANSSELPTVLSYPRRRRKKFIKTNPRLRPRGCSNIMSGGGGVKAPPLLLLSQHLKLAEYPSPLVRNHILLYSNLINKIYLSGSKCEFGSNLWMWIFLITKGLLRQKLCSPSRILLNQRVVEQNFVKFKIVEYTWCLIQVSGF